MKSRITRKEQLLSNIYQNMIDLAEDSTTKVEELLGDMLKVNYYESCFAVQRGMGMGFNVAKISDKLLKQVLDFPWSEKHFSEAVWGQCDHLAALAKREITMGFIQGSGVQKMAKAINDVMDKGRYAAERLVRTECKRFANEGELMGYKENGIQRYRFVGGSEGSGSCNCAALNGKTFRVEDAVAGVNYPPLHPNCLCIIVADFGDRGMFETREGSTPLQENIKFKEWKEKYVDNTPPTAKIVLSEEEGHALNAYISSESYKLNAKLREGRPLSKADQRMVSALDSAIEKMPQYRGTLYRSITDMGIDDVDAFLRAHITGAPATFPAYTSTSTSIYDQAMPIQYVIHSKSGRDIRGYNQGESEILFKRGTTFFVQKVEGHTIYLEEKG